jgi:hypothetical protein
MVAVMFELQSVSTDEQQNKKFWSSHLFQYNTDHI